MPLIPVSGRGISFLGHREGGFFMALSKSKRFEIFKRDGFTCQYCGARPPDVVLEVDHIQPRSKGGDDDELNLLTSCVGCNQGKRAKLLAEVQPRPDADAKTLEVQQEIAELRHYQEVVAIRNGLLEETVELLEQAWWESAPGLDWRPSDSLLRQFLGRYAAPIIEEALRIVGPKVVTGFVQKEWFDRYFWGVLRNLDTE